MKVEKQLPLSTPADTRTRTSAQATVSEAARTTKSGFKLSDFREAKANGKSSGFSLQLNQQLSAMQSTERYLSELSQQLATLKLNLSRQLSSQQNPSDREAIAQGIEQINSLLEERSERTSQSLDANFKLRLNEPLRSRFSLQGLDSLEDIQRAGKETLVFSGGRALAEPLAVVLDEGMSEEDILRRLNAGLGSAGIRAELNTDGNLKFSMPEKDWRQLKDNLNVKGEGKLFPNQTAAARSFEESVIELNPVSAQGSPRELRQLLDTVVAAIAKVNKLRDKIIQRQQDVRDFLSKQENLDEKQWAKNFAGAVFNINSRTSSSYSVVAQTVVAQSQLTRFSVVGLLS